MVEVFIALGVIIICLIGYLTWMKEVIHCPQCNSTNVRIVGEFFSNGAERSLDGTEDWKCDKCYHYWFKEYKVKK